MPARVMMKPARIRVFCAKRLASLSWDIDESRMPMVAAVKTSPVSMALKPRTVCRKTETTNEMPMSMSHWTFWVTRPRFEVRL